LFRGRETTAKDILVKLPSREKIKKVTLSSQKLESLSWKARSDVKMGDTMGFGGTSSLLVPLPKPNIQINYERRN
jgi:hypothetical protein